MPQDLRRTSDQVGRCYGCVSRPKLGMGVDVAADTRQVFMKAAQEIESGGEFMESSQVRGSAGLSDIRRTKGRSAEAASNPGVCRMDGRDPLEPQS